MKDRPYKYQNVAVVKKDTDRCLGFASGNSIAELKRSVKEDRYNRFRGHGTVILCFTDDRPDIRMDSNKF